jgi:hypothetical protein
MSEDSRKALEPLLALAAPQRRRFLKQLLVGSSALAFLALPETRVLAQGDTDGRGKGKAKGKADDGKGKGKSTGKGKGKGAGRGKGTGKGTGKGKGTRPS